MATQLKPWHFAGAGILVDEDDNEFVLSAVFDDEPAGRLIAAAPALRDALTRLVGVFDWGAVHVEAGGKEAITELAEAFAQARAVLAKADGNAT